LVEVNLNENVSNLSKTYISIDQTNLN